MKQDQNRIELRLNTAEYDECILCANEGTRVLPGSLLVFTDRNVSGDSDPVRPNRGYANFEYSAKNWVKVTESVPLGEGSAAASGSHLVDDYAVKKEGEYSPYAHFIMRSYYSSEAADLAEVNEPEYITKSWNPDRFPCAVVLENALYGKSLNHESPAGELVPCRYLNETNEVLLRAVPGQYWYGDVVYAVQTKNDGIWVATESTKAYGIEAGILDSSAELGMKVGICQEDFTITPIMCRIVDVTGPEDPTGYITADTMVSNVRPDNLIGMSAIPVDLGGFYASNASSSRYFGGALVNLIKVRTTAFYASTTPLPSVTGIEITSTGRYRTYSGSEHAVIGDFYNVTGTQDGDDISCTIKKTLYGNNPRLKDAGKYELLFKVSRAGHLPYTKTEILTIAKKTVRISGTTVDNKEYDGTRTATVHLGTVSGLVVSDHLTVTAVGTFRDAGLGEDKDVDVVYSVPSKNYVLNPASETLKASIIPASGSALPEIEGIDINPTQTIGTVSTAPTYNGEDQAVSDLLVVSGRELGHENEYDISFNPATVKNAGEYTVEATITRDGFQTLVMPVTFTVAKYTIHVSNITVQTKTYDGTTDASILYSTNAIPDGFVLNEEAHFANAGPGNPIVVYVTLSIPSGYEGNYELDRYDQTSLGTILPAAGPGPNTGLPDLEGITLTGSSAEYTNLYQSSSSLITVEGTEENDVITYSPEAVKEPGTYNVAVTVVRDGYAPWTDSCEVNITPKQLSVYGTTITEKVYDGTTRAEVIVGTVQGKLEGDDVTVTGSVFFTSTRVGDYNLTVTYAISGEDAGKYIKPVNQTRPTKIKPRWVTVTGTTVSDKNYDGTTDASVVLGTVGNVLDGEEVVVTPAASFPSADPGTYDVPVSYTISGADAYNYHAPAQDTVRASINQAETPQPTYTYTAMANGGPTRTTTEVTLSLVSDNPSNIPASIPYANIQIGGDAVLDTEAENCVGSLGIFTIPVRMVKKAGGDYIINIRLNDGNSDKEVKPVPAYFMSGYWGIYPCQLGDIYEPTAAQIVDMNGRHVLTGAKVSSVSCTFALNEQDWQREVTANGVTGEDADFEESGCGYEFFITCWDDTSVGLITNETNIPQNASYKPFTVTINGTVYSGVVSKNCELPSGTSPFVFNLT